MPTHDEEETFWRDWAALTPSQRDAFLSAMAEMVEDLRAGHEFRRGLRVKKFQGLAGVFEMTWARNGRALFRYGTSPIPGEKHIIWIRIGTHEIFKNPNR